MAIEVVGLEVEEHRDPRAEVDDVLELEARQLADDPGARVEPVQRGERTADVAGDLDRPTGGTEDGAEELDRGGLPVRAGDSEDRRVEQSIAELDLAPDCDAAPPRGGDERRLTGHPRALDHELHALQQRLLLRPEVDFDALGGKPARIDGRAVGGDHLDAAPCERERGRLTGAREADDEHPPRPRGHPPPSALTPATSRSPRSCPFRPATFRDLASRDLHRGIPHPGWGVGFRPPPVGDGTGSERS